MNDGLVQIVTDLADTFSRPEPPAAQEETGFFTDTTICIGCKACEVACKQWNQLPADGFNWTGNSYDNTVALSDSTWRHVAFVEQFDPQTHAGPVAHDERRVQALPACPLRGGLSHRSAHLQRIWKRLCTTGHL